MTAIMAAARQRYYTFRKSKGTCSQKYVPQTCCTFQPFQRDHSRRMCIVYFLHFFSKVIMENLYQIGLYTQTFFACIGEKVAGTYGLWDLIRFWPAIPHSPFLPARGRTNSLFIYQTKTKTKTKTKVFVRSCMF